MIESSENICTDVMLIEHLKAHPGVRFTVPKLARIFGVQQAAITAKLRYSAANTPVRRTSQSGHAVYFWPTEQELAAERAELTVRPFKPYVVPKTMLERVAELEAHRAAYPSHYGRNA